ncbi:hypothetical protein F4678DRAFT_484959 [Xylaria arbuscula]|nr:hypothetical protein F4678DRAFT_484959 [Xylaria arbuscula]
MMSFKRLRQKFNEGEKLKKETGENKVKTEVENKEQSQGQKPATTPSQPLKNLISNPSVRKYVTPWDKEVGVFRHWYVSTVVWMYHRAEPTDEGEHPEWPGYTGVGTKLDFNLKLMTYKAQCLTENTVLSLFPAPNDRNLTPKQLAAREKIVTLYNEVKDSKEPFTTEVLVKFFRLFDEFFFFGALVINRAIPRCQALMVNLKAGAPKKNLKRSDPAYYFCLEGRHPFGYTEHIYLRKIGPIMKICIAGETFYKDGDKHMGADKVHFFLKTLAHEMVHAYLSLFMCHCKICYKDFPNTKGVSGHGKTFMVLLDCMDQTLRSWGVGLTGLMKEETTTDGAARNGTYDELGCMYIHERMAYQTVALGTAGSLAVESETEAEAAARRKEFMKEEEFLYPPPGVGFNAMRELRGREPGMNVFMVDACVGGTRVDQEKLRETCDIVQGLIADKAAKHSLSPEVWMKRWGSLVKMMKRDENLEEKTTVEEKTIVEEKAEVKEKTIEEKIAMQEMKAIEEMKAAKEKIAIEEKAAIEA